MENMSFESRLTISALTASMVKNHKDTMNTVDKNEVEAMVLAISEALYGSKFTPPVSTADHRILLYTPEAGFLTIKPSSKIMISACSLMLCRSKSSLVAYKITSCPFVFLISL